MVALLSLSGRATARWRRSARAGLALAVACATAGQVEAQRGFGGGNRGGGNCSAFFYDDNSYWMWDVAYGLKNPVYDGRITFARIKYQGNFSCQGQGPGWAHDYPRSESHFMRILRTITTVNGFIESANPRATGGTVMAFDNPELFKYPVAYLSEPGGWYLTDTELKGFKRFIERGGFIIFDDMNANRGDYDNLVAQWRRAFPKAVPVQLTGDHSIFNSYFPVDLAKIGGAFGGGYGRGSVLGIFEDNDPKKRMLAVIDYNLDVGELIEYSDQGFDPVPANEAYKLWVNYFIYAVTH
jgi:hypothetical protein